MSREDLVIGLIGHMYEAAMDTVHWPIVLNSIVEYFEAQFAVLGVVRESSMQKWCDRQENISLSEFESVKFGGIFTNTCRSDIAMIIHEDYRSVVHKLCNGQYVMQNNDIHNDPMFSYAIVLRDSIGLSDVYNSLFVTINFGQQSILAVGIYRLLSLDEFGSKDISRVDALTPHLRRAARIQERLFPAKWERQTIDRLPWGVFLVDGAGVVLSRNRTADELLATADGLALHRNRLVAATPPQSRKLDAAIHQATHPAGDAAPTAGIMALSRPSQRRSLSVLIAPVHDPHPLKMPRPTAIVFVTDPERHLDGGAHILQHLYGLTPAEASLALLLLGGLGLQEAAEQLHRSLSTVKTQLQSIFNKTDTSRQSELMQVILKGPMGLRLD